MNRKQIIQLQPQLQLLLQYLRIVHLSLIALVIILYSVSIYCLLKEQMVVAIGLATLAAMLFHLVQKYILMVVMWWLFNDKKNKEMLDFISKEIKSKTDKNASLIQKNKAAKEFFMRLEKALKVIAD